MPGRFANLEFNHERRTNPETALELRGAQKSAPDYLTTADEEQRWGRYEAALRLYTRALQEDRAAIPAWVGQVQMLVLLGESHEGRVWSDKALELFRNNGELLAAKAQACARLGDREGALQCSDASLQAPGSSPWRWAARGEVLLARRQKFADECFLKAVAEPASTWFDRVVIARICSHYRHFTRALQYLKEAVQLEPTHGAGWFELGRCQHELGFAAAAVASFQRCLELRPDFPEAQTALDALPMSSSLLTRLGAFLMPWRRR